MREPSHRYLSKPFEWEKLDSGIIAIVIRDEEGKVVRKRPASDEEVRCVMILEAIAWSGSQSRTPAFRHDPNPFNYGDAIRVTAESLGLSKTK